jgi:hypothetical protein
VKIKFDSEETACLVIIEASTCVSLLRLLNKLSEFFDTLVWTVLHWSPVGHNAFAETELYHVCLYGTTWLSLDVYHLSKILYCGIFTKYVTQIQLWLEVCTNNAPFV